MKNNLKRLLCLVVAMASLCSLVACAEVTPTESNGGETDPSITVGSTEKTEPSGTTGTTEPSTDVTEPSTPDEPTDLTKLTPVVYLTTPGDYVKFVRQEDSSYKVYRVDALQNDGGVVINVDLNTKYQTVEGWGAAMTESSAVNLEKMPEDVRNAVMTALFDENNGIGLNILRVPIGISDFSVDSTRDYVDDNDETLNSFNIDYDKQHIIPFIKQAMELADCGDDFKVFSCSWTAPLWMKTIPEFHSSNKSTLKREYYQLFADYLVKWIQAYEEAGVPIYTVTGQNEPTGIHGIAAMYMPVDQLALFYTRYLYPAMEEAGLDTKLLAWDFNYFDDSTTLLTAINDICGGIGYHAYSGSADLITKNLEMYPDIPVYITEAAGMVQGASTRFFRQMSWIMQTQRRGSSAHILWNIVLDEDIGPALVDEDGNSVNSVGVGMLEWNTKEQKVAYLEDYYALAHFSKFVRPGAVRVESTDLDDGENGIQNIVYLNENGTITAILMNNVATEQTFKIVVDDYVIEYTLAGKSGATITWNPNA